MPNPSKPTRLKLLEGNRGRRDLNQREPQPAATQIKCPIWVDSYGRRVWRRLEPQMLALGILTDFDVEFFGSYCQAVADILRLRRFVHKEGTTYQVGDYWIDRPETKQLENAFGRLRAFGMQFGFSPASRAKIVTAAPEEDPLEALLRS